MPRFGIQPYHTARLWPYKQLGTSILRPRRLLAPRQLRQPWQKLRRRRARECRTGRAKTGECTLPITEGSSSLSAIHSPDTKTKQKTMENKNLKRITKITYPGFALLVLACFAPSPRAQAVVPE